MPSSDFTAATLVTVERNIDAFTVGLAGGPVGEGSHLIFQCALTPPSGQDTATGMDTYCVMDDGGGVQYGGVERAELVGATLRLRFTAEAAEELDIRTPGGELALAVPPDRVPDLVAGLRRVLTYGRPDQHPELLGI